LSSVSEQQMGSVERRVPVKRFAAITFVGAMVLAAVAWGASQGSRTFGHFRLERDGRAVEWRGDVSAEISRNSLELTFPASPSPVQVTLPWPSSVAAEIDAFVRVTDEATTGHAALEETGAYVSGRFDATLDDGSKLSGGFRAERPSSMN